MPHDKNGRLVVAGDEKILRVRVTSVSANDEYCNAAVETVEPIYPGNVPTFISAVNTRQLEDAQTESAAAVAVPAAGAKPPLTLIAADTIPHPVRLHEPTPNVPESNPDYGAVQVKCYLPGTPAEQISSAQKYDARELYNVAAQAANTGRVLEINNMGDPAWTKTDPYAYAVAIAKKYALFQGLKAS